MIQMHHRSIVILFVLVVIWLEDVSSYQIEYGYMNYTEYHTGDLNVILSAPHGGYLLPSDIVNRTNGCWNSTSNTCIWTHNCGTTSSSKCRASILRDSYTQEITINLADNLKAITGKRPHVIINRLARIKLDANRDLDKATLGDANASKAWNDFQGFIEKAKDFIVNGSSENPRTTQERGIFFDIHGHAHPQMWIEFGYLLSIQTLNDHAADPQGNPINPNNTSVRQLLKYNPGVDINQMLYGRESLGGILQDRGYQSVPSPNHHSPQSEKFFSGGYNTRRHGSLNGALVDAIQIESPKSLRNSENFTSYSLDLAKGIQQFLNVYYNDSASGSASTTTSISTTTDTSTTLDTTANTSTAANNVAQSINNCLMLFYASLYAGANLLI